MVKFLVFAAYMGYDFDEALRAVQGKRKENPGVLIFLAGIIDLFKLVKKLVTKKPATPATPVK